MNGKAGGGFFVVTDALKQACEFRRTIRRQAERLFAAVAYDASADRLHELATEIMQAADNVRALEGEKIE